MRSITCFGRDRRLDHSLYESLLAQIVAQALLERRFALAARS